MAELTVAATEEDLASDAAERFTSIVEAAVASRGTATVCLTGGSTPRRLYELLADDTRPWRSRIAWPRLHVFWGDERHVPPEHPDSNFRLANEALLRHVPVPAAQVHRMRGDYSEAERAAGEYDQLLRAAFTAAGRTDLTFDLMLLGIGEDAHIASIFPGSPLLARDGAIRDEDAALRVRAVHAPHLHAWRITLTPLALLDSHVILVVAAGSRKAEAIRNALQMPEDVRRWPAQLLRRATGRVEWLIDSAAAARL